MRGIVDMNTDNWEWRAAKQITSGNALVCTFEHSIDASLFILLLERYRRFRDRVEKIDQVEDANREMIAECKRVNAENKRLRKIEDAAREWRKVKMYKHEDDALERLADVLDTNPRPDAP